MLCSERMKRLSFVPHQGMSSKETRHMYVLCKEEDRDLIFHARIHLSLVLSYIFILFATICRAVLQVYIFIFCKLCLQNGRWLCQIGKVPVYLYVAKGNKQVH